VDKKFSDITLSLVVISSLISLGEINTILITTALFFTVAVAVYDIKRGEHMTGVFYTLCAFYGFKSLLETMLVYKVGAMHLLTDQQTLEWYSSINTPVAHTGSLFLLVFAFAIVYLHRFLREHPGE